MRINVPVKLAAVAGLLALLTSVAPSNAHVHFPVGDVPAGSSVEVEFRVPHGCDGSTTKLIQITIPDGVHSVKPKVMPGWVIETTRGPLAEPGQHPHLGEVTEGVKTITYSGGLIPDDQYEDFPVTFYTPTQIGRVLEFPVLQQCLVGETNWANPGGQEPDPAPQLTLTDPDAPAPVHTLMVGGN